MIVLPAGIGTVRPAAAGGGGDPHWANVVALLHFDGTNGSTTFVDQTGRSWTAGGGAQVTTAQSKFGGASGDFDGAGKVITAVNSSDFAWHVGPYTAEGWVYLTGYGGDGFGRPMMIGESVASPGTYNWGFGPNPSGKLTFFYWGGSRIIFNGTTTIPINQWVHIAFTFDGSDIRLFVEGVLDGTFSYSVAAAPAGGVAFRAGFVDAARCNFYFDDLRITKGVARHTSTFTPPTSAYPNGP